MVIVKTEKWNNCVIYCASTTFKQNADANADCKTSGYLMFRGYIRDKRHEIG